ncbi:transcription-silencing protein Clr2-domain-containing protein [Phyllosticta citribraziliensis]|uniref:Transcription-silencing protein Clr2-domain-containing protein n=1 Tax=Phyllosticta citribraziliensis TaxID=989973 RepID=A0ABR1LSV5_9PEZI
MAPFYPLYIRRSDGRAVTGEKKKESNEPTPEQLNQKPDAKGICDYYRLIEDDEPKNVDWRRKLGGMLLRELAQSGEHQHKAAILAHLPTNYRLFEHIKSRTHDGDPQSKRASKNHAGGGHDRQDAYLYGHPLGRKKRFRSPADFFPHLYWLATDKTGDPGNCTCKICCPEEFQEEKTAVKRDATTPTPGPSQAATPAQSPANPRSGRRSPSVMIPRVNSTPAQHSSTQERPVSQPAPAQRPAPQTQPPNPPQPLQQHRPTPLPVLPFADFQLDMRWNHLLFRPGEVVWHSRGDAWGLGVVIRRYLSETPNRGVERNYIIQPLSNPIEQLRPVHHSEERLLRPWLAWSPPPLTNEVLQNRPDVSFSNVDWQAVLNGQFGQGNAEVDGSILAAKAIDVSFTLHHLLNGTTRTNPQFEERHWGGIFLGAEKIWVGEPVRVRLDAPVSHPVLVILDIVERVELGRPNPRSSIHVVGDLYTFMTTQPPPNSVMPPVDHLPTRMANDLILRNRCSVPAGRLSAWKLLKPHLALSLDSIRGRWYESSILLPMIQPEAEFNEARRRGTIDDVDPWLNGRGDSSGQPRVAGVRQPERRDALGRAVPDGTRIHDGLDPMSPAELASLTGVVPPSLAQAQPQPQGQPPAGFEGAAFGEMDVDMREFMNLDNDFTNLPPAGGANGAMGWG